MKNKFNWKRFTMVLQKDAQDLYNQYLKLMLIVTCTLLAFFLLFAFFEDTNGAYEKVRSFISIMFIWGGMLLAPFQLYKRYNHKINGVNYFMLPASQTEKWTSMFFYCAIATPVVLMLTITLIDFCTYPFFPWPEKTLWFEFFNLYKRFDTNTLIIFLSTLSTIFISQSLFFLGNVWFQRAKVQKTILAAIILSVTHVVFLLILAKTFTGISIYFKNDILIISKTWSIIDMVISFLTAPVGLWVVSFMKMKEQQL